MAMSGTARLVPSAAFQPEMVPSNVEKRNEALVPLERTMPLDPAVVTEPAGVPVDDPEAGGTATLKAMAFVVAGTTKLKPLLAVLIHQVELTEIPHGLRKAGSMVVAATEPSETRLVTL